MAYIANGDAWNLLLECPVCDGTNLDEDGDYCPECYA